MRLSQRMLPAAALLLCLSASAQSLPELKKRFSEKLADTVRINLANKIAWLSSTADSATTFAFANEAFALATAKGFLAGKGNALLAKGNYYITKAKGDEAALLLEQAVTHLSAAKDELQTAIAKEYLGKAYVLQNQNAKALLLFAESEKTFAQRGYNNGLSMAYNNMGVAYNNMGDIDKAIAVYIRALAIDERTGNKTQVPLTLNNIGKLFMDAKNYPLARDYLRRCIEQSMAVKDFVTMGKGQLNCGNTFISEGDYATGITYYEGALASFEKSGFTRGVQACNNNLGALYIRQEQFDKAIPYLQKALETSRRSGSTAGVALTEQNIATAYTRMGRYADAEEWFKKSESSAAKNADLFTVGEIYNHRAELDSARGDYKSAYAYKIKYLQASEKILNEKNSRIVNELQTKYETQKKETQITLLNKEADIKGLQLKNQRLTLDQQLYEIAQNKLQLSEADLQLANNQLQLEGQKQTILQQHLDSTERVKRIENLQKQTRIQRLEIQNRQLALNRRNILLGALAVALLLFSLLGYSFYRRKQLQQEARLQAAVFSQQQAATKAVMEAEEAERQRIAKDLHDGVGQMMSAAKMNLSAYEHANAFASAEEKQKLERIIQLVDESCTEVRAVAHNMMPNALLKASLASAVREFISKLDGRQLAAHLYTEGLDERLDSNTEVVLYRVIQECVNNVIKHAGATTLDISIAKEEKQIAVTVEDNGKGFDHAGRKPTEGMGLKNIRTRVQYLKGSVEIDAAPGKGTMVAIYVPV